MGFLITNGLSLRVDTGDELSCDRPRGVRRRYKGDERGGDESQCVKRRWAMGVLNGDCSNALSCKVILTPCKGRVCQRACSLPDMLSVRCRPVL